MTWCASSFHIGNHEWIVQKWSGTKYIPPLVLINPTGRFIPDDEGIDNVTWPSDSRKTFYREGHLCPKGYINLEGYVCLDRYIDPEGYIWPKG